MRMRTYLRLAFLAFMSIFLVACKPTASFTVNPNDIYIGTNVTFDASNSSAYRSDKGNTIVSYNWVFGDGTQGTGKTFQHAYNKTGSYIVTVTVTDKVGGTSTASKTITVKPTPAQNANVKVTVTSADGALLKGINISSNANTVITDGNGLAQLTTSLPTTATEYTIKAISDGFITQAVKVKPTDKTIGIILQPVKDVLSITDISQAQTLKSTAQNTIVTFAANSFVKADKTPATGAATVKLTPWNIQGSDINAMLGNGLALTTANERVSLISAGMLTFDIVDSNNQPLNLASGKTADIQMDLPIASINNQALTVGSKIPLWHFDENQGLWIEEGIGEVIASTTSPVKLAVKGTVSHFSTWNWDIKFVNSGSVDVKCLAAAGTAVDCNVTAEVTLADGSKFTRSGFIPATGAKIINMPTEGTITWTAVDSDGLRSPIVTTNAATSPVTLTLAAPKFASNIQCQLASAVNVACQVEVKAQLKNGTNLTKLLSIGKNGGSFVTLEDVSTITYNAISSFVKVDSGWVKYTGSFGPSSATTVIIPVIDQGTQQAATYIYASCQPLATIYKWGADGGQTQTKVPVNKCTITFNIYNREFEYVVKDVTPGQRVRFDIPYNIAMPSDTLNISANSTVNDNGTNTDVKDYSYQIISDLQNGGTTDLTMKNNIGSGTATFTVN